MKDIQQESAVAALKITPAVGGLVIYDLTLEQWVAIVTICYVLLQIGLLVPKYVNVVKTVLAKLSAYFKN